MFTMRFSLLVILPVLAILSFLLYESTVVSKRNDQSTNEKLSSQVVYNITKNMTFAQNLAKAILQNEMLINFLDKPYQSRVDLDYYRTTIYDYVKVSNGLSSEYKLRIYLENETIPTGYSTFYHFQDLRQLETIQRFYNGDERELWIDGAELETYKPSYHDVNAKDDYCFLRKITIGDRKLGLILIQMPKSMLNDAMGSLPMHSEQIHDIFPLGNRLVYNFTASEVDDSSLTALQALPPGVQSHDGLIMGVYSFPQYPFDITVVTAPSMSRQVFQLLLVVFLAFMTVTVWLFVRYSSKIIRDIKYCLDAMNSSIDSNFQNELHVDRKDEIFFIAHRINYLIARIRKLVDTNIRQQISAKGTQLIALQHQINPHFLYNTMEIFSSRMELSGLFKESSAMSAFCQILRYNINSDKIQVAIREELQQIQNYISIQKIRELDVKLDIDIPESILSVKIIRFVLQPFIENSFKYRREDGMLHIRIAAVQQGHSVMIVIQDNGVGIANQQLVQLNAGFRAAPAGVSREDKHIGLFNINERLKLFYGEDHAIHAAMEDGYTTFRVRIRNDIAPLELPPDGILLN
ncbi:histidine kinase [Cohnella sp. LGH]|uniref:sensor histidine kinase n=1 Tax=Cohnella sp. LGH TaxID=1619153 RepID=UPI001ADBAFCB|nr:histidine kinase [Cohnella sp. LGH]QTH43152.1 histidine kinase [Cohnella sp. LGH]